MRKMLLWIVGIAAFIVLLTKSSDIIQLLDTVRNGAFIPLLVAAVFQVGNFVAQAFAYSSAFGAVGERTRPRKMLPLLFGSVFVNTLAPTGGTAGTVLIIDDSRRRGIPVGRAASAALLMQLSAFSGFIIIMVIGFIILQTTGRLSAIEFLCGMVLVLLATFLVGVLFAGRKNPELLISLFTPVEKGVESLFGRLRREPPAPWVARLAESFSAASNSIAENPFGSASVLGYCTLASALEMLCFIAVGSAFGVAAVDELVAGYVIATLFAIISIVPQGVGFAEAAVVLLLASYGIPSTIATALALVYRGFAFWIPFAIGAVLLRKTSLFAERKEPSEEERSKGVGNTAGLLVFVFGVANVLFAILPSVPSTWNLLTSWISMGNALSSTTAVLLGIILMLMIRGLTQRSRTTWACTLVLLVYLAVVQILSAHTYRVVAAILLFVIWLFVERRSFDRIVVRETFRKSAMPIVIAAVITLGYGVAGFWILHGHFVQDYNFFSALLATLQTFLPFIEDPIAVTSHGGWFLRSLWTVGVTTLVWSAVATVIPWLRGR